MKNLTKKIYIDFTHSVPLPGIKYHGGGIYTKRLLQALINLETVDNDIFIFWPRNYEPIDEIEKQIVSSPKFSIVKTDNVFEDLALKEADVLYFPLLPTRNFIEAKKIKLKHTKIKIYVTIHGTRFLELSPDKYDELYYGHRKKSKTIWRLKCIAYKKILKSNLHMFDKIFTDSNSTLQNLVKYNCKINFINYYYAMGSSNSNLENEKKTDKYLLCVSGNRYEKNFARSLEAFCQYKINSQNEIYLYVTGIDKTTNKNLQNKFVEHKDIIAKWVRFYEYVEEAYLNDLYKQCMFLLYPSKSEGFGLPILEAALCGKPSVTSYITSMPEVMGASAYYVNPYDISSIRNGIEYMCDEDNLNKYCNLVKNYCKIVSEKSVIDHMNLIDEIVK